MHGLTDAEWRNLRASLKTSSRDRPLSPGDVAALLNKAMQQCSLTELAVSLEFKDQSTLRKIANLGHLEADLLAQVTWGTQHGTISMTVAAELQRLPDAHSIRQAFQSATRQRMNRTQARELARRSRTE